MKYIWAVGVLAAGQSSTLSGTYTGGVVMSGIMTWSWPRWQRVLFARAAALVPTVVLAVVYGGSSAMDSLNQLINVLQSFQLPFALLPILYMTTRRSIMGDAATRGLFKWAVLAICAALLALNFATAILAASAALSAGTVTAALIITGLTLYVVFVAYLAIGPAPVHALLQRAEIAALTAAFGWLGREDGACMVVRVEGEAKVVSNRSQASERAPLLPAAI